jgi:hypothetical protein
MGVMSLVLTSLVMLNVANASDELLLKPWELRPGGYHNAGMWSLLFGNGTFPEPGFYGSLSDDPETGQGVSGGTFGYGQNSFVLFASDLMIGGIVGTDTLVSNSYEYWYGNSRELQPEFPDSGGCIRTGNFADDEFYIVYTDTVTDPLYVYNVNPFNDPVHTPLGVRVTQKSYSWADPLYDNFVIIELTVENIRNEYIHDMWLGMYVDPDIYESSTGVTLGYRDDFTGLLDTVLYDSDPSSQVFIPYAADNDGDPVFGDDFIWDEQSMPQAVSFGLLHTTIPDPQFNYNWWFNAADIFGYGPRRIGTPEDPFRTFADSLLGPPKKQEDLYYVLSHPEVDFNQLDIATIDSSSGWIPSESPLTLIHNDTRFLFSIGEFDLLPGESETFVLAIVGTDDFHPAPNNYYNLFDPESPEVFQASLNFDAMVRQHRKVDSVYKSGYVLPRPGAPIGLCVDYADEQKVILTWNTKGDPNIVGYFLNINDTLLDDSWKHAHQSMLTDTSYTYEFSYPGQELFFAVTAVDNLGRESLPSHWTSLIVGRPNPPDSIWVTSEGVNPQISWNPSCDTCLHAYYIYRSENNENFILFDSTASLTYRDYTTESGRLFKYYVRVTNMAGAISDPSETVSYVPMALDRGLLFFDLNSNPGSMLDAFRQEYVLDLIASVESSAEFDYVHIDETPITLELLSRYKIIVFDKEKEGGKFESSTLDEITNYLRNGGKALFIVPNATIYTISRQLIQVGRYEEGTLFHDVFKLDSAVANRMLFTAGSIYGDLTGCESKDSDYPHLEADSGKLVYSTLPIEGGIPMSGYLYPIEGTVDTLYTYTSLYPDSIFHNQVNGIRYQNEDYAFILFNFPLSIMEGPENIYAFRQALSDLGVNLTCGDYNDDRSVNIGDALAFINYLYRDGAPPPDTWRADIDCNEQIGLSDVLIIINRIFRSGSAPACCPAGN